MVIGAVDLQRQELAARQTQSPTPEDGEDLSLTELSVNAFTQKLASADPTPGGGSVAAAVGSFGAGLVRMVALLTGNSPKHVAVADRCREIAESAGRLTDALLHLERGR